MNGFHVSRAIHVAATLVIADLLRDDRRSSDELAAATGAHPPSPHWLLRARAGAGVFRAEAEHRFTHTRLGDCPRSDVPEPLAGWMVFRGQAHVWVAWRQLQHSVQTGESAFRHIHGLDL